jgi:PII-like signaling protein
MLPKGAAKKVTIYLNGDTRHHVELLWNVIFSFLKQKQISGATVIRGDLGFGSHGQVHDTNSEYAGEHLPMKIEFIETPERVDELLPFLYDMVTDGLIEVQDTTIVKDADTGRTEPSTTVVEQTLQSQPERNPLRDFAAGPAKLVRIYLGESDKFAGEPLYEAIVKKLRMLDFAGATVYRGILGYGVKRHTHKSGRLHFSRDLPIMISVVERTARLDELISVVTDMLQDGLVVVSDVEMYRVLAHEGAGND